MADGKKIALGVGLGCGALLILGCCLGSGTAYYLTQRFDEPARHAHAFFRDLRQENYGDALRRMDAAYQRAHEPHTFAQRVTSLPALAQQTDSTFTERQLDDSTARLAGHLTTAQGDVPVEVTLSETEGHWYIESVTVQGTPL